MTTRALVVGDGARDETMLPPLIEALVGPGRVEVGQFEPWARLHTSGAQRGYGRKLLYALRQAEAKGLQGLVATVDRDKAPKRERLSELQVARDYDRSRRATVRCAVGEADPHAEAWLLDDYVAVQTTLALGGESPVPNPTKVASPKAALNELLESVNFSEPYNVALRTIAANLQFERCRGPDKTGLSEFREELHAAFDDS